MQPDLGFISAVVLTSIGYQDIKNIAKRIAGIFQLCSDMFT